MPGQMENTGDVQTARIEKWENAYRLAWEKSLGDKLTSSRFIEARSPQQEARRRATIRAVEAFVFSNPHCSPNQIQRSMNGSASMREVRNALISLLSAGKVHRASIGIYCHGPERDA